MEAKEEERTFESMMKKFNFFIKGLFALFAFLMIGGQLNAEPIIADHNAVAQFDQYKGNPDFQNAVTLAKSMFHVGYGHTSHGSQITSGMTGLNIFLNNLGYPENLFSWNNGGSGGALDLEEGDGYGYGWLDHDCGYSGWDNETRYYLESNDPNEPYVDHSDVNVIMWSWCGQVDTVDIQTHYLDNMADLEAEYPGVTFIYMTGHLEGRRTGDAWFINNNAIRNWVSISKDRVLFDFADIEKYDPEQLVNYADFFADDNCDYDSDGAEPRSEDSNWATEWQESHTQNIDWYSVSCAHSQSLNCNQKAKAFWWMMARMAGWNADGETNIYVSQDGTCGGNSPCYSTIQAALNAATDGDLIKVSKDTYEESLTWNATGTVSISGGWNGDYSDQTGPTEMYAPSVTGGGGVKVLPKVQVVPH